MNERVSIKEGGLTRELSPIDKVKANNTDGTQSIWVSKDDMHTGTLYATENGIYIASEDGYDAYDEVLIRVTDESYDGSNTWKDVDPDVDRYTWDDTTYQDYKIDPDSFDDKFNDPTKWKDEDLGDNLDYKYNDGNSISGIDPETGKPVEYSVDEDGFLDEEDLPWMIEITVMPERTEFYDGHRIVFSGIEVCSVTDIDGEDVYKPIPYNELIFPVTIAEGGESGDGVYTNMEGLNCLQVTFSEKWTHIGWDTFYLGPAVGTVGSGYPGWGDGGTLYAACKIPGSAYLTIYNNKIYGYGISVAAAAFVGAMPTGDWAQGGGQHGYIGTFAIQRWREFGSTTPPAGAMNLPVSSVDPLTIDDMSNLTKTMEVPVEWIRPDGEMLETQYNIKVLPNPSGV